MYLVSGIFAIMRAKSVAGIANTSVGRTVRRPTILADGGTFGFALSGQRGAFVATFRQRTMYSIKAIG